MLKKIQVICYLIFLFFLSIKFVCASSVFYDDFEIKDFSKWNFTQNLGLINIDNSSILLTSNTSSFPFVISNVNNIFPKNTPFNVKINFKFPNIGTMGDGIGIGFTGNGSNIFYQFGIWSDSTSGSKFIYNDFNKPNQGNCIDFSQTKDGIGRKYINLLLDENWHIFEIEENSNTSYKIFLDREKYPNPIFVSDNFQCIPQNIWFGNKFSGGSFNWSSLMIDYIKVFVGSENPKIIILPGLGASWNTEAMVYNWQVGDDQWKMTPFVKNYDGLISAFQAKGLVKNKDFFVWNYDWRKPVPEIENKLNTFIDQKVGTGEKVDLVGHSLGGLVARIWSQNNKDNGKLNKVITISSPNSGSINAYEAWNGAKISDKADIASIALNLLVQLQRKNNQTKAETIKNFVPVLKDLLPTFDFIKKDKKIITTDKLAIKNDFLKEKNLLVNSIFDKFRAIAGIGFSTKEWINVVDRSVFDKVLGIWTDGKPESYSNTNNGDSVVLKKSASFDGDNFDTVNSDHWNVVNKSINKVFSELGLGTTVPVVLTDNNLSDSLILFIGSPADLSIKCDNNAEIKSDSDGFAVIKNNNLNNCKITVNGTGNGVYHLVVGESDLEDSWQYFEDNIGVGITKSFSVEAKTGKLTLDNQNLDYLYGLIKKDASDLLGQDQFKGNKNLTAILSEIENKNINSLINDLFLFRKDKKESLITNRIIEKVVLILTIENKNVSLTNAKNFYNKALQSKSLVDATTRLNSRNGKIPSNFSSLSYQKLEEFVARAGNQLKLGNLAESVANSILVPKLSQEVW